MQRLTTRMATQASHPTPPGGVSSTTAPSLVIISYNLHGLKGQGGPLLHDLCNLGKPECIIMVQEHWLPDSQMYLIDSFSPSHTAFGVSAMTKAAETSVLRGRPYGGVSTLIHHKYISIVKNIHCEERFNLLSFGSLIILNVYLPCCQTGSLPVLINVLDEIDSHLFPYINSPLIIGGDLNCDLTKGSPHAVAVLDFLNRYNLILCNDIIPPNCSYTYFNDSLGQKSMTDFFLISTQLLNSLAKSGMMDKVLNLSDHLPIKIELNFEGATPSPFALATMEPSVPPMLDLPLGSRLRWDKAHLPLYYNVSHNVLLPIFNSTNGGLHKLHNTHDLYSLIDMDTPALTSQVAASRAEAVQMIEFIHDQLVEALSTASINSVPRLKPTKLKHWWNADLNRLKGAANAALKIWRGAGKPPTGEIFEKFKKSKKEFKTAIKYFRKKSNEGVNDSLMNSLASSSHFWALWRSKLGKKKNSPIINNQTSQEGAANEFAAHFAEACSPNSPQRARELLADYEERRSSYNIFESPTKFLLSISAVEKAVSKLSGGTSPGADNITREHVKHAHPILLSLLTKLFNLMLLYQYVPSSFGCSIIIPILKPGKPSDRADSYRGISLNSIFSKIFEHCLLSLF